MITRRALVLSALAGVAFAHPALADGPGPLNGRLFGNGRGVLFVALHGDLSSGRNADYQHGIAQRVARAHRNVTGFGLIRPGYRDSDGRTSPGNHSGRRDHYTARNNALVAETIANLKASVGARRVVALGHSGGAAQLGAVIANAPGLIDSAILVSCPCDIRRWRNMRGRSPWGRSQSPSRLAGQVSRSTRVIALTGANDPNTYPILAQDYVAGLQARGVSASFASVQGAAHGYNGALQQAAERAASQEISRA